MEYDQIGQAGGAPQETKHTPGVSNTKLNPRVDKAEETMGKSGVKAPWETSHQITRKGGPHWDTHPQNSQGLKGQTSWEHKGAKRGNDAGPDQRRNPYEPGQVTLDHTDHTQNYVG